ncbi:hypothetical protein M1145_02185 [Patescibacteria group bacterium]|nr:hypothetical protein [Patescibacteria group bacterium]
MEKEIKSITGLNLSCSIKRTMESLRPTDDNKIDLAGTRYEGLTYMKNLIDQHYSSISREELDTLRFMYGYDRIVTGNALVRGEDGTWRPTGERSLIGIYLKPEQKSE